MEIYCIRDKTANYSDQPFFVPTEVHATRMFKARVNDADQQNLLYLYPGEYDLVNLGTWDARTGKVTALDTPKVIANGNQVKETK